VQKQGQQQGQQQVQKQGQQQGQQIRRRHHPHRHYFDVFNYPIISPFDYFDTFFNQGFFSDYDLPFYGFRNNMLTDFGRIEDEFFGQEEFNRLIQQQKNRPETFQTAKSVRKHTRIENGQRVTVTEVSKLNPDGTTNHEIKQESDDGMGNRQVRYLDKWPENLHQIGQQSQQGQIGQQKGQQGQIGQQSQEQAYGKGQAQGQSHAVSYQQNQGVNK